MPITAKPFRLAGVPVLIASPASDGAITAPLLHPTVLWFHGFRADALAHAAELEQCAAQGFLAVGVDAVDHGARRDDGLPARVKTSPDGALPIMLEQIAQTMQELPMLMEALVARHGADRERVSVVGISMGAFLAYRAIVDMAEVPFRSAVALLGSPPAIGDPESYRRVALLSITAEHDVSVPPAPVHRLHERLAHHDDSDARHRHHVLRGAGHLTTKAQWDEAMHETLAWLRRYG